MHAEPQKEHHWLQKLVGEWSIEMEAEMGPGQPKMKSTGIDRVRALGGLWMICEGEGHLPDGKVGQMIMTLGYDPAKSKFVGSFVGSMMSHQWVYEGSLDAAGRVLTLDTVGPSFPAGGKLARYQDIIEFLDDDTRTLVSQTLGEDGKWSRFMTAVYKRTKK